MLYRLWICFGDQQQSVIELLGLFSPISCGKSIGADLQQIRISTRLDRQWPTLKDSDVGEVN